MLPQRGESGLALNVERHLQRHMGAATRIPMVGAVWSAGGDAVLCMAGQSGEEADKPALILHAM